MEVDLVLIAILTVFLLAMKHENDLTKFERRHNSLVDVVYAISDKLGMVRHEIRTSNQSPSR